MANPGGGGGFMKSLAEQKLKSFSIGTMGKRTISRKEQEELRKRQEEEDVGKVYQEFVSTFEDKPSSKVSKTWVKAGTFNAGSRKEDTTGKGQLYKPTAKFGPSTPSSSRSDSSSPLPQKRPEKPGKKKQQEKKKSNLEIFKEELKAMQAERDERHRLKAMGKSTGSSSLKSEATSTLYSDSKEFGSHDNGDPNTTNLYLGNLSPRLTEQQMMELFGRYGPLASIKIMWPRTEDEKSRGRNCGFVAFMSRKDGERALANLSGKDIDGFEMKMGWGKPVAIPLHPIYVPPAMLKLTMPPLPSGLPFNCQPKSDSDHQRWTSSSGEPVPVPQDPERKAEFDQVVHNSVVKVVIPTDRTVLCQINRMIEFVIREGPMFEAMIMNKEMGNPNFAFLFENRSPEHIYYRWRLFSLLQGDSKDKWSTKEFRLFKGGSIWRPPPLHLYTSGMPEELVELPDKDSDLISERSKSRDKSVDKTKASRRGLSDSQRDRFEDMLRTLHPDRNPVAEAMVWCLEHADACEEIVECIAEALSILETPLAKKIARLYLISDILHNCSVKGVPNVSYYRKEFEGKLPEIFSDLRTCHQSIESRMKAEGFRQRVMNCFRAWEDWALYPQDFLIKLQNIFLGLITDKDDLDGQAKDDDDVDGKSLTDDEDVDGMPLDGSALLKRGGKVSARNRHSDDDSDVDGVPLEDSNRNGNNKSKSLAPGFVPSKWETIDPDEVQAQAVTSKWEMFEQEEKAKQDQDEDEDIDGEPMEDSDQLLDKLSEDNRAMLRRRAKLRDIELKVMCYQDALESGKERLRPGYTVLMQVEEFRSKLNQASPGTPGESSRYLKSDSEDDDYEDGRRSRSKKSSRRSRRDNSSSSSSRSRSRSRSRDRSRHKRSRRSRSRSRSRSPSRKHKKRRH